MKKIVFEEKQETINIDDFEYSNVEKIIVKWNENSFGVIGVVSKSDSECGFYCVMEIMNGFQVTNIAPTNKMTLKEYIIYLHENGFEEFLVFPASKEVWHEIGKLNYAK